MHSVCVLVLVLAYTPRLALPPRLDGPDEKEKSSALAEL